MRVDAYRKELATELDGKDPRGAQATPGSVVLVFPDEGVITVQIQPTRVRVVDGGASLPDLPTVLVRGRLLDWLRYCEAPTPETARGLEIFGDEVMLEAMGRLVDHKRSPIAARFFGR